MNLNNIIKNISDRQRERVPSWIWDLEKQNARKLGDFERPK